MITVTIKDDTAIGKALLKLGRVTGIKPEMLGEALVNAAAKDILNEDAEQAPTESNKAKAPAIA